MQFASMSVDQIQQGLKAGDFSAVEVAEKSPRPVQRYAEHRGKLARGPCSATPSTPPSGR